MFAQLLIQMILVTLWPQVLRDCEAAFIIDSFKMTPSRCVGSITFLDESQHPRVTFNRSVRRVRRLEAKNVLVEGCGCYDLYKLRHFRGSSQQVGPGVSEVNLPWVRSVQKTECEGYPATTVRRTKQVKTLQTTLEAATTTAITATTPTRTTEPTFKTTAEITSVTTSEAAITRTTTATTRTTEPTILTNIPASTSTVLNTSTLSTATTSQLEAATVTTEGGGCALNTVVESHTLDPLDKLSLGEETTKNTVMVKHNPLSKGNINKQQTSTTRSLNNTFIIVKTEPLKEDMTATRTETYQTSPKSINTVSQTSEPGSLTQFIKTSNKKIFWKKKKSPSGSEPQNLVKVEDKTRNSTFIKSEEDFSEEGRSTRELNQQVERTDDLGLKTDMQKVNNQHEEEEEEMGNLSLKLDATVTGSEVETNRTSEDATDPITEHGAVNEIQKELMEPKMSSLVSLSSNSALTMWRPIVFILIVQILLK